MCVYVCVCVYVCMYVYIYNVDLHSTFQSFNIVRMSHIIEASQQFEKQDLGSVSSATIHFPLSFCLGAAAD